MPVLPTGTITFLFTDVEGSTRLWERHPDQMRLALARHDCLIESLVAQHAGVVVRPRGEGDSRFAVFPRATDAVAAAAAIQRALHDEPWSAETPLRARLALHTGEADLRDGDYYGSAVNRCARLRAAGHGGQTLLSDVTVGLVRDALPPGIELRDLGEHRLKDLLRPERIFQLLLPGLDADFPPLVTLDHRPHNLPVQRSPLIGREREVAAVSTLLLRDELGLVTLTGPGGIGKTRLAQQVAAEVAEAFPDGVWLVLLAPISDPALVPSAVAQALGVQETGTRPLRESLQDFLREKRLLLVLDNFEQVGEAAPLVADLLVACPYLKFLVTSRAPLHLSGEHEVVVPSLPVPDPTHLPRPEALSQYDAVALFIQRAVAAKADFAVTNENAPAVAEICARVDGLPLAIELAAARIKLLPPQALLARLGSRLKVLTGGTRDAPVRQQTLRAAIDWSYRLLDGGEQTLFARLAVFVGGCCLEAAEAVCTPAGDLPLDVLDVLSSLVDKSLLRQDDVAGEARFWMLETIREYAQERLAQSGEATHVQQQHAAYYLAFATATARVPEGFDRLEQDHDNLRAALCWLIERRETEPALRLATALTGMWGIRGYLTEGRDRLAAALALPEAEASANSRAAAHSAAGRLAFNQGDYAAALRCHERSLALWREIGDTSRAANSLNQMGHLARERGDYATARTMLVASLEHYRLAGDRRGEGSTLNYLGLVALQEEDYAKARTLFQEALGIHQEVQHEFGIVWAVARLGHVAHAEGNLDEARARYEQSLATLRRWDDKRAIATLLRNLGMVDIDEGQFDMAWSRFEESAALVRHLHDLAGTAMLLDGLAGLAAAQALPVRALRLAGAAAGLREALDKSLPRNLADWLERKLAPARDSLGREAAAAAWGEGHAMSLERAVAYALEAYTPHACS